MRPVRGPRIAVGFWNDVPVWTTIVSAAYAFERLNPSTNSRSFMLLLKLSGLGNDEILAVGREFGFSAGYVERGHGADFELLFVVVVKLFGHGNRLLLHLNVFASVGKFIIRSDGVGDGGDGLLREGKVGQERDTA